MLLPFAVLAAKGRRILLGVVILDLPLQISTHLFWDDERAKLGAIAGLEISVSLIALVLLYIAWIVGYASRRELHHRPIFRTSLPMIFYLLFFTISIFAAEDRTLFAFEFCIMVQMVFLYIYLINWVRTRQDVMFVFSLLLIGMVLESVLMMALRVGGSGLLPSAFKAQVETDPTSVPRVGGTLGDPNSAGTYFALLLAPALSLLITRGVGYWYKILAAVAFCVGGGALVITFSRGGWLSCATALAIVALSARRLLRPGHKALCLLAVVMVASGILIQKASSDRLLDKQAASSRIPLALMALRMIADNPLIGVGANNYTLNMDKYATGELSGEWMYAVHNKYLLIWAETGPGALIAFVWFIVATLRRGWKSWKFKDPFFSPLALGLTAGLVGFSMCLMLDPMRGSGIMSMLLITASLITAMHGWVIEASAKPGMLASATSY